MVNIWAEAEHFLQFFDAANKPQSSASVNTNLASGWIHPQVSELKLNTDAAWDSSSNRSGFGAVLRNHKGELIMAAIISTRGQMNPAIAEARALLEGIRVVKSRNWQPAIIESDSLSVSSLCRGLSSSNSDVDNIVFDIKHELSNADNIVCLFTPRDGNTVAHGLAKWALNHVGSTVWNSRFPSWLSKLASVDVMRQTPL